MAKIQTQSFKTLGRFPFHILYNMFIPETIKTSAELMNERREYGDSIMKTSLKYDSFWPANVLLCRKKKGKSVFQFGEREAFQIIYEQDVREVWKQLINKNIYVAKDEQVVAIDDLVKEGKVVEANPDELNLKIEQDSEGHVAHLPITFSSYGKKLNPKQRRIAEVPYGKGDDFEENMKVLKDADTYTSIFLPGPSFFKEKVSEDKAIVLPCFITGSHHHVFHANPCYWKDIQSDHSMRGEPLVIESDKTLNRYQKAYETILTNEKEAVDNMTPEISRALSDLVRSYHKKYSCLKETMKHNKNI